MCYQCVHKQIAEKFMLIGCLPSLSVGALSTNANLLSYFEINAVRFDRSKTQANESVYSLGLPVVYTESYTVKSFALSWNYSK